MHFPFSLTGAACWWIKKEPSCSILTSEDLVSKFINEFFPPSRTTNLRNEIANFHKRFDESFHEAWDRYKDLLRTCPRHGFTELYQLDTLYNALNPNDQESLNSTAGGNQLERYTQDVLTIIKNKSKCLAADGNTFPKLRDNIQGYVTAAAVKYNQGNSGYRPLTSTLGLGNIPSNTIAHPKGDLKAITTRSGIVLDGAFIPIPPLFINLEEDECVEETLTNQDLAEYTINVYPSLFHPNEPCALIDVHGKEMILCDDDERLTLNMRHDTSSYSNKPKKESINMINIYNDSSEDFLEDLFEINHQSGNTTFSSHPNLTLPKVKDDVFDLVGGNVRIEKFLDLESTKDMHPPHTVNPLSGSTTSFSPNHFLEEFADEFALIPFSLGNNDLPFDIESDLKEIEYLLHHDPIKDMDSILKDLIDQRNLADLNDDLADTMPEMFT
uniref:Reverse transcriptase domain-containing protein n=1 Tax=Tanacetum cinerariifolium TaxID=118510 RepID=A0A6L2NQM1_TANCI|nr:reverse transcriptase domain-containing protein [Tanacetum cinerariifolium]